jgi:outer membrane protein assembly factor BamB
VDKKFALVIALTIAVMSTGIHSISVRAQLPVGAPPLLWRFETGSVESLVSESAPSIDDGVVAFTNLYGDVFALDIRSGEELWRYRTSGEVASSPHIVGGAIYVASSESAVALDAGSGVELWKYEYPSRGGDASLAVSDSAVFLVSGSHDVFAVDRGSGSELWQFEASSQVEREPVVAGGVLYIADTADTLYEIDPASGSVLSTATYDGAIVGPLNEDRVYLQWHDGPGIWAKDKETNQVIWSETLDHDIDYVQIADSLVLIFWSDSTDLYTNMITALRADTGEQLWDFRAIFSLDSAVIEDGAIYLTDNTDKMHALNPTTGEEIWRVQLGDHSLQTPAIVDGVIYVGAGHSMVAFSADQQGLPTTLATWQFLSGNDSSAAVADGVAFIANLDGAVDALDLATGSAIWSVVLPGSSGDPVVRNGVVVVAGAYNDPTYGLDAATGQELWSVPTQGSTGRPVILDGTVFLSDFSQVTAFDLRTGSLKWQIQLKSQTQLDSPSNVAVDDEFVYVGAPSLGSDGHSLYAIKITDGSIAWEVSTGPDLVGRVAVDDNLVYAALGFTGQTIVAFEKDNGQERWRYSDYNARTNQTTPSDLVVSVGYVYASMSGKLVALDTATGAEVWSFYNSMGFSGVASSGELIIGAGSDASVYALDAKTGTPEWRFDAVDNYTWIAPLIDQGIAVVTDGNGWVYGLDATSAPNSTGDGQAPSDEADSPATTSQEGSGQRIFDSVSVAIDMYGRLPLALLTVQPGAEIPVDFLPGPILVAAKTGQLDLIDSPSMSLLASGQQLQIEAGQSFRAMNNSSEPASLLVLPLYTTFAEIAKLVYSDICTECTPNGVEFTLLIKDPYLYPQLSFGAITVDQVSIANTTMLNGQSDANEVVFLVVLSGAIELDHEDALQEEGFVNLSGLGPSVSVAAADGTEAMVLIVRFLPEQT